MQCDGGFQLLTGLPGYLLYCFVVVVYASVMIYKIAPVHGKKNPLIYLSICSTVGSVSVMSVKAFGIAVKLTFAGHNQFSHASTYVFMILTTVCILIQMNYFNKALATFSTQMYFAPAEPAYVTNPWLTMLQSQPLILRNLHDRHAMRFLYLVWRLQHVRCGQHAIAALRFPHHLFRCLPTQPVAPRSQWRQNARRPSRR